MACEDVEFSCLTCALGSFLDCGLSDCLIESVQAEGCLWECYSKSIMMGTSIGACLQTECPTEFENLSTCATPVMRGAECAPAMESCGIVYQD